ncbi:MAG TPA: response regulator [Opitutales bacterium]|nr:response regulator [Opitutales bacterium]
MSTAAMPHRKKPLILVVDDQPININLLERKLQRESMDVITAANGRECLEAISRVRPDLILLDVMMPEMDGIETCERLKKNPDTNAIPIIFITARSSKEGKLEGLNVGAVDYITKPIDLDETLARVKTQLRLQEIHRENIELQKRLGESRRTAAVGAVTQGVAHNLNNLLGVAVGYLDLLKTSADNPEMVRRSVVLIDSAVDRMIDIIRQLSTIASIDRLPMQTVQIQELLDAAINRFREEFKILSPVIVRNLTPKGFGVRTNSEILESILGKLLINAFESLPKGANPDGKVELEARLDTSEGDTPRLVLQVLDRGCGISPEVGENLFDPFITTKTAVGRGLGLTMARHAIRNLGGDIEMLSRPEGGTIARLYHPVT